MCLIFTFLNLEVIFYMYFFFQILFLFQFDLGVLRPIISNHETNPGGNDPASLTFLFAENPWSCDCEFVKEIQDFLYHRIPFLRDAELLYCGGEPVSTK